MDFVQVCFIIAGKNLVCQLSPFERSGILLKVLISLLSLYILEVSLRKKPFLVLLEPKPIVVL